MSQNEDILKKAIDIIDKAKSADAIVKAITDSFSMMADLQGTLGDQMREQLVAAISGLKLNVDVTGLIASLDKIYSEMQKPCEISITLQLE